MPKNTPKPDYVSFDKLALKGFERIEHVPKSSFKDCSMVILCPTRGQPVIDPDTGKPAVKADGTLELVPMIHRSVTEAWQSIIWPMNGKRAMFIVSGAEVGKAYDEQLAAVLQHPDISKWKYLLTLEDDNIPPADAVMRLLEAIEAGPFDGVGALYFTKGEVNMPMAYGSPEEWKRTGVLDFRPRDVTECIQSGGIMPVNGVAMGCTLYRMSLFKEIPAPWFVTYNDIYDGVAKGYTQDLAFCEKAIRAGKTFATDCRVRVGHLDFVTGEVY